MGPKNKANIKHSIVSTRISSWCAPMYSTSMPWDEARVAGYAMARDGKPLVLAAGPVLLAPPDE